MLLGFNSNGLQNHRLEDAIALLADHGYRAIALTLDVAHLDPFRCSAADVTRIGGLLARHDLVPLIETGARYLLDPRRKHEPTLMTRGDRRHARLDFYARAAAIGRDLGARVLSFWSGVDREPGADSNARLRDGVAAACDLVRSVGLEPALEPEPGMAVATLLDYDAVAQALGDRAPYLCLDVGHLYVTQPADPLAAIAGRGPRLRQVHLEDIRAGVHEHLPPGQGDVDFRAARRALATAGYAGAVCFELSRSSHAAPEMLALCKKAWETAAK
jgi:sugar phosphate isomerase/epimerase